MTENARSKVGFVIPLDLCHIQQAVDKLITLACGGQPCRSLVLSDVSALELSGSVHRSEPAAQMAEKSKHSAGDISADLPRDARAHAESLEHPSDKLAMMPLIFFDLPNLFSCLRVGDRAPVAAIRVSGGKLSRVCQPQEFNQILEVAIPAQSIIFQINRHPPGKTYRQILAQLLSCDCGLFLLAKDGQLRQRRACCCSRNSETNF